MDRIFNMDNKFFTFMGRVADLMILNILCILCCIPIITAGASITAMFYVTLKMVRNEESYIVRGFFKSFKENFKQSTIINLIMIVTALLIYFDITVSQSMSGTAGKALFTVFLIILIVYLMIFIYIYPLQAKFYNTIKNTFINAFLMSIRHLPYTLLMAVVTALPLCIFFISSSQVVSMIILFLVLMGASTIAYINSNFFVKIFDNYIPKEEEDAPKNDEADELPGDAAGRITKAGETGEASVQTAAPNGSAANPDTLAGQAVDTDTTAGQTADTDTLARQTADTDTLTGQAADTDTRPGQAADADTDSADTAAEAPETTASADTSGNSASL